MGIDRHYRLAANDVICSGALRRLNIDEPNGIFHEKTYFPEPCEYLFINHGPLQYLDADGNTVSVLDWMGIEAKWDDAPVVE